MRLDHLLSKENIVIVCFVAGLVLVSVWLVTRFLGGTSTARGFMRVWGISETRMSVFVFGF